MPGLLTRPSAPPSPPQKPLVGGPAPDFKAQAVYDQEFMEVKLSNYKGKKYVVLLFYPLDFTFVCPTELTAFSDSYGASRAGALLGVAAPGHPRPHPVPPPRPPCPQPSSRS